MGKTHQGETQGNALKNLVILTRNTEGEKHWKNAEEHF